MKIPGWTVTCTSSRMETRRAGFSLIETLIAMAVLVAGICVVAHLFAYSVVTASTTRDLSAAAFLATRKLEELRALPHDTLPSGGGLEPASPVDGFWELVSETGEIGSASLLGSGSLLCLWQVDGIEPRTITVAVFGPPAAPGRLRAELIRVVTRLNGRPR